jgi:hypothetical protein
MRAPFELEPREARPGERSLSLECALQIGALESNPDH